MRNTGLAVCSVGLTLLNSVEFTVRNLNDALHGTDAHIAMQARCRRHNRRLDLGFDICSAAKHARCYVGTHNDEDNGPHDAPHKAGGHFLALAANGGTGLCVDPGKELRAQFAHTRWKAFTRKGLLVLQVGARTMGHVCLVQRTSTGSDVDFCVVQVVIRIADVAKILIGGV